jgi:Uma2 family endonuclease
MTRMTAPGTATALDRPEPAWDIALLYPPQGQWSEEDYLVLEASRLVELSNGCIEVLEMPTQRHQKIVLLLLQLLIEFVTARHPGTVLFAGIPVRLWPGKFREPDVVYMRAEHAARMRDDYWEGADLVMEVVSGNRDLDLVTKRREYAQGGIPEYWIVDPQDERIVVLTLHGDVYQPRGVFGRGETATSAALPGFQVDVDAVMGLR